MEKICPRHGLTEFFYSETEKRYRCKQCRIDSVIDKRRRNKIDLVKYKGGKCVKCGYDKCIDALEFHHIDNEDKDFGISSGDTKSLETLKKEVDKCILVCANCHREIHSLIKEEKIQEKINEINQNIAKYEQEFGKNNLHKSCHKVISIDKDKLIELVNQGVSKKEIASFFKVSSTTINCFLKKYNINYEIKSKLYFYSIEKLKNDLKEIGTFEGIGKKYNVNGNSIRKWCVKNGLPFHIKEIKNIINNGSV